VLILIAFFVLSYIIGAAKNFVRLFLISSHLIIIGLKFVLFTYTDSCDCLTQVWLVYLIRMPAYIYTFASPLFHLTIMIERVLATVYVKIYEKQGKLFGVISTIIVVIIFWLFCYSSKNFSGH